MGSELFCCGSGICKGSGKDSRIPGQIKIVQVECDGGAVGVFVFLSRFKGLAQGIRMNHGNCEILKQIIDVGVEIAAAILFHQLDLHIAVQDQSADLVFTGLGTGQIHIAFGPDRKMAEV